MVNINCIELRDIYFYYRKENFILDNLNIKFYGGKLTALLGINGCGKTTIFKILTCLCKPQAGSLLYNNVVVDSNNVLEYKSQVGFMPEFLQIYQNMYVKDVLYLLADLKGCSNFDVDELLERVFLSLHSNKKVKALSKGMKQKLNLAQAILGDPKIILFDEPSNGFDCGSIDAFYSILRTMADRGSIVLISSHHLTEIYSNVDRVVILSNGNIVKEFDIGFVDNSKDFTYKDISICVEGVFDNEFLNVLSFNYGHIFVKKNRFLIGRVSNSVFINLIVELIKRNYVIKDIRVEDKILENMLMDLS